jgi:sugar/nucleoside kinase (ribokinase family)
MSDVTCVGSAFLDLTFEGLEALPAAGQERYAGELHTTPGGMAITAVGLARLGLRTALVAPLGRDLAGSLLRRLLEDEGVDWAGPEVERTPVSAVMPVGDERAFVTFEPPARIEPATVAGTAPRAVVVDIGRLDLVPQGVRAYAVVGDALADLLAGRLPAAAAGARALVANRSEAARLTGEATADGAALALADVVQTAVVTCDSDGAVAASGGELVVVHPPAVEVRDTTGAGDLLTAAYVWGDLQDQPLGERLRRAVVYAALSVRSATGAGSAATLEELEQALAELEGEIVEESSVKEST